MTWLRVKGVRGFRLMQLVKNKVTLVGVTNQTKRKVRFIENFNVFIEIIKDGVDILDYEC